jgi:hypothetical protein
MKAGNLALLFAVLIAAASVSGRAQDESIRVRGTVIDESGAPAADISVSVRHLAETKSAARSAADGGFVLDVPRRSFDGVLLVASDEKRERLGTHVHPDQSGDDKQDIRIVLRKAHDLDVTVTDAHGDLVPGARVAAIYRQQTMAEQITDEGGRAVLHVPAEVEHLVYAVKRGVGLDYVRLRPSRHELWRMRLSSSVPVRIRVLDERGGPVVGARVYPQRISRLNEPLGSFHLWEVKELHETTDEAGVATCHVPISNVAPVPFQVEAEGYARSPRVYWMPDETITGVRLGTRIVGARMVWENEFTVELKPTVVVQGTVVHADGRPAAGASAGALGYGYDKASYVQGTQCQADGTFKLSLPAGLYYVFTAQSGSERSPYHKRVLISDRSVEPLKIVLQPARRLFGMITSGPEKSPVARQHLSIYWRDDESYSKLPVEERLPNPMGDTAPIVLSILNPVRTDDEGRFEFLVAPGRYYIASPEKMRTSSWHEDPSALPQVDVTELSDARIDVHSAEAR